MNRPLVALAAVCILLAFGAGGCSKSGSASSDATAAANAGASLEASIEASAAAYAGATSPAASPSSTASAAASDAGGGASPGAASSGGAAFTDISGVNGEKEIVELAGLGIVDPTSGAFSPGRPVKRREFIRWLTKSNNVLWADMPAKQIKLADKTESSSFTDITTGDPDFAYIQGMQDAGYSVGFPDKTFEPDRPLTREQMFAIKNVFDRGQADPGLAKDVVFARNSVMPPWRDKPSISKTYVAAIATGASGGNESFSRVYGASALFHPQMDVTRAQAAVLVSVIGDHVYAGSTSRNAAHPPVAPTP